MNGIEKQVIDQRLKNYLAQLVESKVQYRRTLKRLGQSQTRLAVKQVGDNAFPLASRVKYVGMKMADAQRQALRASREARAINLLRAFARGRAYKTVEERNKVTTLSPVEVLVSFSGVDYNWANLKAFEAWVSVVPPEPETATEVVAATA